MRHFKPGRIYWIPFLFAWAFVVLTRTISISGSPLQVQNPNVNINAVGGTTIGTAVPVTLAAGSGGTTFSTPVMGSAIPVGITTVAPFGTTTTLVQGLYVTNSCATAVTVTIADGNNIPFVGSETASNGTFSVPSLGNLPINMGIVGHVLTSGMKTSAVGSNNCIFMWAEGKQ